MGDCSSVVWVLLLTLKVGLILITLYIIHYTGCWLCVELAELAIRQCRPGVHGTCGLNNPGHQTRGQYQAGLEIRVDIQVWLIVGQQDEIKIRIELQESANRASNVCTFVDAIQTFHKKPTTRTGERRERAGEEGSRNEKKQTSHLLLLALALHLRIYTAVSVFFAISFSITRIASWDRGGRNCLSLLFFALVLCTHAQATLENSFRKLLSCSFLLDKRFSPASFLGMYVRTESIPTYVIVRGNFFR